MICPRTPHTTLHTAEHTAARHMTRSQVQLYPWLAAITTPRRRVARSLRALHTRRFHRTQLSFLKSHGTLIQVRSASQASRQPRNTGNGITVNGYIAMTGHRE